ncbi:hypothetical protein M5K25_001320 [Dendrobium thyrsiflorum]|uniref:RNase H type-1 domain-containing protein n=1 Tax=Dendrobium thyrsiflorum TaxID=117978 RepID=A0ABD0VR40_DENTH
MRYALWLHEELCMMRLCKIKLVVEPSIQWGLGEGNIFFWQDRWLNGNSIDSILNTISISQVKVNYFFNENEWDVDKLLLWLPEGLVHQILQINLNTDSKDIQLFAFSKNGKFRLKDAWNSFRVKKQLSIVDLLKLWFVEYKGHIRNIIPSLIVWYLWLERNNSRFQGIAVCHSRIIQNVIHKIGALYSAKLISGDSFKNYSFSMETFGIELPTDNLQRMSRIVVWLKPRINFFKLNVDTVMVNSVWGCGGIIRDSNGDFLVGFVGPSHISDGKYAINYTILYGLNTILSLGIINVVIEVSSKFFGNSFIWLDNTESCSPNLFYMRRDIIILLSKLNCDFSKVYVKGNVCANAIASLGCGLDSMVDFLSPQLSNRINGLIALDKIGLPYVL